jgi:cyclic-di-GMP-binding protein
MVATESCGASPMPSFDVVSEVDTHELTNAIDQANRELSTRFDFKGVDARFERDGDVINQTAPTEFQLKQMNDILRARLAARGIDVLSLEFGDIETNLAQARQKITVKQGIEQKIAKKIAAALKDAKLKVESQINGDKLRVQGKKRDDLQEAIAVLKAGKFELPLQFNNFRD